MRSVYRHLLTFLVVFAVLIPIAAEASQTVELEVILGAGTYLTSHHWRFDIDNTSSVALGDTGTIIASKESAYLSPGGNLNYVEFGDYTDNTGSYQYFYTRTPGGLDCISPYTSDWGGYGCRGSVGLWGETSNEDAQYEADYYPGGAFWAFWVQDINYNWHQIASQSYVTDSFYYPRVGTAEIYTALINPFPTIFAAFTNIFVWQGGSGPNWLDTPTAYSVYTFTSLLDYANCPDNYAINQLPDQRSFIIGKPLFSITGPTCNANPFWPR